MNEEKYCPGCSRLHSVIQADVKRQHEIFINAADEINNNKKMNDYVFKIDSPWGNKGEKVPSAIFCGFTTGTGERYNKVYYHEWPDLFEKVKSDADIVHDWFLERDRLQKTIKDPAIPLDYWTSISALWPEFLELFADRIRRGK